MVLYLHPSQKGISCNRKEVSYSMTLINHGDPSASVTKGEHGLYIMQLLILTAAAGNSQAAVPLPARRKYSML